MISDLDGRNYLQNYIRKLSGAASHDDARSITRDLFTDELLRDIVAPWLAHVKRITSQE